MSELLPSASPCAAVKTGRDSAALVPVWWFVDMTSAVQVHSAISVKLSNFKDGMKF